VSIEIGDEGARGEGAGLAGVEEAVERWRAGAPGRAGLSPEELRDALIRLRHLMDLLELEFAALADRLAGCGEDEWEGEAGPTAWLSRWCKTSGGTAWSALVVGQQAGRLGESAQALRDGEIGFAHLALIAQAAQWVASSATITTPAPAFDQAFLLDRAREGTVSQLRRDCAHLRHAADPRRFLAEQIEQVKARFLELKASEGGGLWLRGFLDTEGGAALRCALEPLSRPAEGEERPRDRRLADALVELCGHVLDSGSLPQVAGQRPHLQVTVALDSLRGAGAPGAIAGSRPVPLPTPAPTPSGVLAAAPAPAFAAATPALPALAAAARPMTLSGPGPDQETVAEADRGTPAAELELGGPLAAETARRLGCDAQVSRVIFGPRAAVLEVGRATRVPAAATRRAARTRDRGCVWPGCGRPASWGEIHHLHHWARGGSTDLHNLVTLCRPHHWRVHEGGWQLIRAAGSAAGGQRAGGYIAIAPMPPDLGAPRARAPDGPEAA